MLLSVPRAVVLLGGAVSFVSAAAVPGPLREYTFDAYLRDFGKRYADPEERAARETLFLRRRDAAAEHNAAAASSYTRAVNHLSDGTEEELQGITSGVEQREAQLLQLCDEYRDEVRDL